MKNKKGMTLDQVTGMSREKQDRFNKTQRGECRVKCRLEGKNITNNKSKNYIKILMWLNENKLNSKEVNMEKFNLADITFQNSSDANYCLESIEKARGKIVSGFIDSRSITCRSVIADWPYDIPTLWEEIVD